MIKNSVLYYGMPQTGKSTMLLRIFLHDHQQHQRDLCINMWTFLHKDPKHARYATLGSIDSPNGRFAAMRLPYDPNQWIPTVSAFHQRFPHIRRVMIDEAQCINSVYLVTLIMVIRDFYPNVPVIFTCIDYDSWHHKLPQINALIKLVPKSHHLHHRCIFCHRVANRRLHVINNHPAYNEKKYDYALEHHLYKKDGRPNMYSVCLRHYNHSPKNLMEAVRKNDAKYMPHNRLQQAEQIRKNLGLNKNVKIRFGRPRQMIRRKPQVNPQANTSRPDLAVNTSRVKPKKSDQSNKK